MDFQPKDYYEAASDRMDQADLLYSLDTEYCQGLEDRRYAFGLSHLLDRFDFARFQRHFDRGAAHENKGGNEPRS